MVVGCGWCFGVRCSIYGDVAEARSSPHTPHPQLTALALFSVFWILDSGVYCVGLFSPRTLYIQRCGALLYSLRVRKALWGPDKACNSPRAPLPGTEIRVCGAALQVCGVACALQERNPHVPQHTHTTLRRVPRYSHTRARWHRGVCE